MTPQVKLLLFASIVILTVGLGGCALKPSQPELWYLNRIYFHDSQGNIHPRYEIAAYDPSTGQSRTLFPGEINTWFNTPRFSPDGKWIAFVKEHTDSFPDGKVDSSVWIASPNEAKPIQVAPSHTSAWFYWLPDNSLLIEGIDGQLVPPESISRLIYDPRTKRTQPVTVENDADTCIFQYYANPLAGIETECRDQYLALAHLEVHGTTLKRIEDTSIALKQIPGLGGGCLTWTPDGKKMAFCGTMDFRKYDVFVSTNQ